MLNSSAQNEVPLVLDLDGTLIHIDTFHKMTYLLCAKKPWLVPCIPLWLLKSRPYAKERLSSLVDLLPQSLPYNSKLLDYVKSESQKGRPLILATGTDQSVAEKIAEHLGFFQDVIGSNGKVNMTGPHKRDALLQRFGTFGFDYAGDALIDLHVWQVARKALVVRPKPGVLNKLHKIKDAADIHHFPS